MDVGYQYDINGDAPAYPLNVVADANSLAAYLGRRLNQDEVVLPVEVNGDYSCPSGASCTAQTDGTTLVKYQDGSVAHVETVGKTTYVTFESDGLPLTQPLRALGSVGERIADVIDPALKVAVDYGYPNNDAIANPGTYTPAGLVPGPRQTIQAARNLTEAIKDGLGTLDGQQAVITSPRKASKPDTTKPGNKFTPQPLGDSGSRRTGPVATVVKSTGELHKNLAGAVRDAIQKPGPKHDNHNRDAAPD